MPVSRLSSASYRGDEVDDDLTGRGATGGYLIFVIVQDSNQGAAN